MSLKCKECGEDLKLVHEGKKVYLICENCGNVIKAKKEKKVERRKLSKEEQIEKIKEYMRKRKIPLETIDLEAEVDGSLTFEENLKRIKEKLKVIDDSIVEDEFNEEKAEILMNEHLRKVMQEEFQKDIERIKKKSTPELDKYFRVLKEMIKIVVKSDLTGLIIYGDAGLGKTFQVLKTLGEMGLKVQEDYVYISTHITPLELYNLLYKYQDRIIILDDCEKLLEDLKTVGILKSALWSSVGKRYVFYYSTTDKREAPEQFEFKGKLILLFNRIPSRYKEVIDSLMSRVLTYKLDFTYEERIKIMYELCKLYNIPFEIVDYIKERTSPATDNVNFRTLIQLNLIYKYYKQNPSELNGSGWKVIADDMFKQNTDPIMEVVCELIKSGLPVKEQVRRFTEKTGLGRTSYFYYKAKLNGKVKSWNEYN